MTEGSKTNDLKIENEVLRDLVLKQSNLIHSIGAQQGAIQKALLEIAKVVGEGHEEYLKLAMAEKLRQKAACDDLLKERKEKRDSMVQGGGTG